MIQSDPLIEKREVLEFEVQEKEMQIKLLETQIKIKKLKQQELSQQAEIQELKRKREERLPQPISDDSEGNSQMPTTKNFTRQKAVSKVRL